MLRTWIVRLLVLVLCAPAFVVLGGGSASAAEPSPTPLTAWGQMGWDPGEFEWLNWLAVDADGDVYTTEFWGQRVQRFSPSGTLLDLWGTSGSGPGEFQAPAGIAIGGDGFLYIVDDDQIQKHTPDGTLVTEWGSWGQSNGEFQSATGIAVDDDGFVYVVDTGNSRIQKFTANGVFVSKWGNPSPVPGGGDGQFNQPEGIAVHNGIVYVVDSFNHRVQRFSPTGTFLGKWGTNGTAPGQFQGPKGVAVDAQGNVYVVDHGNDRVQKFTATGTFVSAWGEEGTGIGEFRDPWGVAVDQSGDLYVADWNNHRVQAFGYRGRPDAMIKKGVTGTLAGDGVYNTTGAGQTRRATVARGASVTYRVPVQNDAAFAESLRVRGTASNTAFRVRYYAPDASDITALVTNGTYPTPVLAPGATHAIKVVVTVRGTAPVGASLTASLKATSTTHPSFKDTVKFVTRRA